nr:MAG TPA: hypothetical protein [Caudoviricetes sp.]
MFFVPVSAKLPIKTRQSNNNPVNLRPKMGPPYGTQQSTTLQNAHFQRFTILQKSFPSWGSRVRTPFTAHNHKTLKINYLISQGGSLRASFFCTSNV